MSEATPPAWDSIREVLITAILVGIPLGGVGLAVWLVAIATGVEGYAIAAVVGLVCGTTAYRGYRALRRRGS